MASLPSWYPGDEVKPAPMPLLLVQGFVNTVDIEEGSDLLDDPGTARRWLVGAGLLDREADLTSEDARLARGVRESIRAMLLSTDGSLVPAAELEPLRLVAGARRARLALGDHGAITLESPGRRDVQDALFELLLIVRAAQEDGTWARLKLCANSECRWAYYDRSKNQQGNWCNMAVCGNRLKNRQLRARRT
ncbi:MAG TPA: CGNR zinc finger domain-containing protein [Solirubrobacteraceae bacterium]